MKTILDQLRTHVRIGEPLTHERMAVVPLFVTRLSTLEYLTLGEATEKGLVEVDEVSQGGSVPDMKVSNRAREPVLIPDGTALVGSKQNRVVNLTILVDAESETVIPVSCVEGGRWSRSVKSSTPQSYADKGLRVAMCRDAGLSLKRHGKVAVDQHKVWGHVGKVIKEAGARSPTSDYQAMFEHAKARLEEYEARFRDLDGAAGAAVLIDGKVEAIDLFDKPETFAKLWPDMLRGHAVGAVYDVGATGKEENVDTFLKSAESAEKDLFEPVGIGTNLRLDTGGVIGAALIHGETMVHVSLFAD